MTEKQHEKERYIEVLGENISVVKYFHDIKHDKRPTSLMLLTALSIEICGESIRFLSDAGVPIMSSPAMLFEWTIALVSILSISKLPRTGMTPDRINTGNEYIHCTTGNVIYRCIVRMIKEQFRGLAIHFGETSVFHLHFLEELL